MSYMEMLKKIKTVFGFGNAKGKFEPDFMKQLQEFSKDRETIRSKEGWYQFRAKWFDTGNWPKKKFPKALAKPRTIHGRIWNAKYWAYDLSPLARYEYFLTLHKYADPLFFPIHPEKAENVENMYWGDPNAVSWSQECPYCEISTSAIGDRKCPICLRLLMYVCVTRD